MSALLSNHTWDLISKPNSTNILGSHWLYCHGRLDHYKGHLFAQGFSQQPGLDFYGTFSHVVKPATICTVLSISISHSWPIHQLDAKNSFICCDLVETVYMCQCISISTVNSVIMYVVCKKLYML